MPTKKELLKSPIQHLDIKQHNVVPIVDAMSHMAYSARDTARAANIYDMMLRDTDCGVILCLAGSLISAGVRWEFRWSAAMRRCSPNSSSDSLKASVTPSV